MHPYSTIERNLALNPYMRAALDLAREAMGQTSPNPSVGCVIVRDEVVVGRGAHYYAQRDHAEIVALAMAGETARNADVYVTLEPCSHQGRTGPCAEALISAGVRRVIAAMQDPNPLVAGMGFTRLRQAGIEVVIDHAAGVEAARINEPFLHYMRTQRPLVTLKSAVTLDGKIAAPEDNEGWITSISARTHVQSLRHHTDVMITGIGTVLADDCMLTDRTGIPRSRPLLRVVLDSQLRLPLSSRMVHTGEPSVMVATTTASSVERRNALEAKGVEVVVFDAANGRVSLELLVQELGRRKYLSAMIEAGSKVNWAALDSEVVDKIFFYYAPKILGGLQSLPVAGGLGRRRRADAIQMRDIRLHPVAPEEFAVEGWVQKD
ncbi:bifunctional diaminohydroxyphosphoribosylaminopyrimidine deaminase/5-amino-6-(5-phosphoribosylamino)uracil reductase RibD [Bryobacter aggregatus]|uniref:bifunctional diaminohydroxyphosphoribosylaminopyrimidine deaminase/5-amino-6-(5-phosphoribosylamino)uracil reductase RibD n=1 Tax=Bryobacter aggregatus TaxID=360054 RepID=UPI000A937FF6|nr:bifunctional diaminohydroxyphosphoribosylaminopyrimidine deaminase/5-amino-6-(5-phosphoribosylamino)uracil reductase RibD [Bryobacter aggregatus]